MIVFSAVTNQTKKRKASKPSALLLLQVQVNCICIDRTQLVKRLAAENTQDD